MSDVDETIENVHTGVSITAKVKRGEGTRDQDEIKIKAKGADASEAIEEMGEAIKAAEEWAVELRTIQPEVES